MDYVVGSVAALITGNVTPSRPKLLKRALTPKKHPISPNITPKSEVEDRSIFLSPTLQKKKCLVKKSPKRIFENPDLDVTTDGEGNSSLISPKADKVKKHLKEDLETDSLTSSSPKSRKKSKEGSNTLLDAENLEKKLVSNSAIEIQVANESTPKKKKKSMQNLTPLPVEEQKSDKENADNDTAEFSMTTKKKSPKKKLNSHLNVDNKNEESINDKNKSPKKKKKKTKSQLDSVGLLQSEDGTSQTETKEKSKKKNKRKKKINAKAEIKNVETIDKSKEGKKLSNFVNPNAITHEDSDSEHESDNNLESDSEINNKKVLDEDLAEKSSDEDEEVTRPAKKPKEDDKGPERREQDTAEEAGRTLFVGNVLFSAKCKKEIKNIFSKYGQIETIRIRTVPVKDGRVTPKLAIIKNELHPERSTVNMYIKFQDPASVDKALAENNRVLNNCHLRVTRSDVTGQYDHKRAVFVGNLPFAIEDETLLALFEKCGQIDSVRIVRDKKTNAGKGFGYVNFASKDGVELALNMTDEDLTIKNKIIRVKRCTMTQKNDNSNPGQKRSKKLDQNRQNQGQNRFNQGQNRFNQGENRFKQGQNRFNPGQNRSNQGVNRFSQGQNRPNNQRQNRINQPNQDGENLSGNQQTGAYRRLMNKRQIEESGGPANKKQRKEFVGLTADKKKKHKFNKVQKKKRAISEILTK